MQTTRKHPRTMQEAFGPYTSRQIDEEPVPMILADKVVVTVSIAVMLTLLAALIAGVI